MAKRKPTSILENPSTIKKPSQKKTPPRKPVNVTASAPTQEKMAAPNMEFEDGISPTSKINVFKLDIVSSNGRDLSGVEIGAADIERIWTDSIIRELDDLSGYTSTKSKGGTEIRLQYQLKKPMSIRDIAWEAEFNYEREGTRGTEILRCRVVGLSGVRQPTIGEKVKITVITTNFDISSDQIVEWIAKFGKIQEGHR
jgi:hypothetical protein